MRQAKKTIKKNTQKSQITSEKKKPKKQKIDTPRYVELKGFLSFFILHELSLRPLSGDDLAHSIGLRRSGALTPGTIYPALKRLRRQKLVQYRRNGRKKVYFLTTSGKSELSALYSVLKNMLHGLKKKIN